MGPVRALISKLNRIDQSNPIYGHPCPLYQFEGIIALVTLIGDDTEDRYEEDAIVLAQSKSTSLPSLGFVCGSVFGNNRNSFLLSRRSGGGGGSGPVSGCCVL